MSALRGLRFRLIVGFALVAVVSALGTGALVFREARTGLLQQSQDGVVRQFRDTVDEIAPGVPGKDGRAQGELDDLVADVARTHTSQGWTVMATWGGLRATTGAPATFGDLSPELLRSVATRPVTVFQRVDRAGTPWLVVGVPVTTTGPGGSPALSGLALYLTVPQKAEQGYVGALVTAVEHATVPALALALVLALLVARGVLRPVRALRTAARRMAQGHLDVRLSAAGSDELADLSRAFNDTAAALEESVAGLRHMESRARRFAADVSHELRTPLAAMAAVTDVLDDRPSHPDPIAADAMRLVSQETARLSRLVDDLMEISRFDAHAALLALDEIDLCESVRRTLAARGWQDRVDLRPPGDGVLRARVDPRRFDVVVANLVGNALRHGAPPVLVTLTAGGGPGGEWAAVEISDGGPGIPERALPHIFERFYKADGTRARSQSSGLGLAITAENVRLHGGTVHAANRPGGGAVFTVNLPRYRAGQREQPGQSGQSGQPGQESV